MKKVLIISVLIILLIGFSGCDIELGHKNHDHDGDGFEDHDGEDHDGEDHDGEDHDEEFLETGLLL